MHNDKPKTRVDYLNAIAKIFNGMAGITLLAECVPDTRRSEEDPNLEHKLYTALFTTALYFMPVGGLGFFDAILPRGEITEPRDLANRLILLAASVAGTPGMQSNMLESHWQTCEYHQNVLRDVCKVFTGMSQIACRFIPPVTRCT